jgi:hypothetical protein
MQNSRNTTKGMYAVTYWNSRLRLKRYKVVNGFDGLIAFADMCNRNKHIILFCSRRSTKPEAIRYNQMQSANDRDDKRQPYINYSPNHYYVITYVDGYGNRQYKISRRVTAFISFVKLCKRHGFAILLARYQCNKDRANSYVEWCKNNIGKNNKRLAKAIRESNRHKRYVDFLRSVL